MQLPLQERVIAMINEARRLSAMIDELKQPETAMIAFGLLPDWEEAARQAIHLCRLAALTLPQASLDTLIDRVNALDEEGASGSIMCKPNGMIIGQDLIIHNSRISTSSLPLALPRPLSPCLLP
jgi:hypothetical protein